MRWLLSLSFLLVACQSQAPLGAICTSNGECGAPLVCRLGRCRNECTVNRDCPAGSQCFLDANGLGACELDVDRSCGSSACGTGLTCLSSECVRACSRATECPSDGVCSIATGTSIGVCTDTRTTLDAGPMNDAAVDAFVDDAGTCTPLLAISVCAGADFTCAVRADTEHTVVCWGSSDHGQVGRDPSDDCNGHPCALHPLVVPPEGSPAEMLTGAQQVTCGDDFACARLTDGSVACWGRNYALMLGAMNDEVRGARAVTDVNGVAVTGVDGIVGGSGHTCATTGTSGLVCWGNNQLAQLGRGAMSLSELAGDATALLAHAPFARVFAMSENTCVVTQTAHDVFCIGDNEHQQILASATPDSTAIVPMTAVHIGSGAIVGGGGDFACFVDTMDHTECWGWNQGGALGRNMHDLTNDLAPARVFGPASNLAFDGFFTSTGIVMCGTSGGALYCWGENAGGAAGMDPARVDEAFPALVSGPTDVSEGWCGQGHCCAVDGANHLWCWGGNTYGQLGRGTTSASEWMPAEVCAP